MIAFIAGTTAELIKVAPVYHALVARGTKPLLWFTAQHVDEVADTLEDLRLPEPDLWLVPRNRARNLETPSHVPGWALSVARTALNQRKQMRAALASDGRPGLVVVHGDTFTTPYGSFVARRLLGARVAHVEAGMRSGSLLSPLPEELNRRIASKLTDIHFAPSDNEVHNLRRARGVVVDTGANTVIDAMRLAIDSTTEDDLPPEFGLATLHRFELVQRADKFREALELLRKASERTPMLYLAGAPERERIERHGWADLFDGERFIMRPKRRYLEFLPILARAKFVVTDSGGLQQECAYLGMPCAIHRERTETKQGLGENIVLTGMRSDKLAKFLDEHETLRRPSVMEKYHPSQVIVDTLAQLGYV
ncbi:UDP-N-acetylglucosamine 2-epimerase [Saccharothrix yanglingensis]|uniref:UDP-N-acetylglucosamine 2-epimerase n=1 Tax=Saccharothrix yanglingensis TaxID=659496 RepID=A0ABU0WTW5_9PSEU|nr:UDP-N-acetylglucosamine 2-epimerase [Saccharothrix yanglingensis]MDQ2583197.1 UDP-N-acetylglucosamine 2-epimerase [Saccharothrix yanglingensis]